MLPPNLQLENLDEGIRKLVVNINRIPEVFTETTCEGHIWKDTPKSPTKDGWVHFSVHDKINEDLITRIKKEFLETHQKIFELKGWGKIEEYFQHTMYAHYEPHNSGELFNRLDRNQQRNYFRRAETRKKRILEGWMDFNGVIESYLRERFGPDYERLPFR